MAANTRMFDEEKLRRQHNLGAVPRMMCLSIEQSEECEAGGLLACHGQGLSKGGITRENWHKGAPCRGLNKRRRSLRATKSTEFRGVS